MLTKVICMALLLLLPCGCATCFQEAHFFKSGSSSAPNIPNYYRLKISGFAIFSSSRYVSGFFDEDTVNTYFNEYTQPAGAALRPAAKPAAEQPPAQPPAKEPAAEKQDKSSVEPVSKDLEGKKLIMILSSNSDEIATQIGALAASKQFTASLAGLVARDQYTAADAADSRLTIEKSRAQATSDLVSQVVDKLPDEPSADDATKTLLAFINALAFDLGHEGAFKNLADATLWLQFNRARLLRGER